MPYKNYIISKGGKELGITWYDIENHILTPAQFKEFKDWMRGQTVGFIDDSCATIVYTSDLLRFIKGLPVND